MKYLNRKPMGWVLGAGAVAMLSVWGITVAPPLEASSHREAPMIADDPQADVTDVYAFRSPADPTKVVLIANYVPFQLPQGGPNYYTFGDNVRYEIHVKNNPATAGDDVVYRFTFTTTNTDGSTFFYARLGAQNQKTTYTCEKIVGTNAPVVIATNGVVPAYNVGPRTDGPSPGAGIPADYTAYRLSKVKTTTNGAGERLFAGSSDDPFFVDLGAVFDLAGLRVNNGARDGLARYNVQSIAVEVPISALSLNGQPAPAATGNILDSNYIIGVWASASRPSLQTLNANGTITPNTTFVQVSRLGMPLDNEAITPIGGKDAWNRATPYTEAATSDDYLSNPELGLYVADNTPVAPANTTKPAGQTYYGQAVPALNALRVQTRSLYGALATHPNGFDFRNGADGLATLTTTERNSAPAFAAYGGYLLVNGKPRSVDLKPIFHTGVPNVAPYQLATGKGGNPLAAGKPFVNNFLLLTANAGGNPGGDMLRLNMAVPVTPRNSPDFSNEGLVAAAVLGLSDPRFAASSALQNIPNMDGFPNGRRLEDDVTKIELQAVGGVVLAAIGLWYDDYNAATPAASPVTPALVGVLNFSAGVEHNDTTSRADFPYVQTPWQGYATKRF